ncbi:hypothetical protein HDU98_006955 [Podochytrium sp. JEL0797]|nr:hypothetical protein HDU98_006955 [Podochytrium sp. JEL0797]
MATAPYDALAGLDFGQNQTPSEPTTDQNAPTSKRQATDAPSQSMDVSALGESLEGIDASTQALLASLLASSAGEENDTEDVGVLMRQMDSTLDALGELETRAEDILGKLDAFLRESGFEGEVDLDAVGESVGDAGDAMDVPSGAKWDEKCFVIITQTPAGRARCEPPSAKMRCIQRLFDGAHHRDKTILFKHSKDFDTVMNQAAAMMRSDGNPASPGNPNQDAAPSPSSSNTKVSHPMTPLKDIELHSQNSVAEYEAPSEAEPLPKSFGSYLHSDIYLPSKAYVSRIYAPPFNFFRSYAEGVQNGKAFTLLGRYYDAVVIEQRPLVIGWKMSQKVQGWVEVLRRPQEGIAGSAAGVSSTNSSASGSGTGGSGERKPPA